MNIRSFSWTWLREVVLFAGVGVMNTAVDIVVLNLLVLLTHHDQGWWLLLFDGLSFLAGLINSYVLNGRFTFRDSGSGDFGRFLRFVAVNAVGLLINTLIVWTLSPLLGGLVVEGHDKLLSPIMAVNVSKGLATVFSLCWNYLAMKYWIFRREEPALVNDDGANVVIPVQMLMERETKSAV